MRYNGDISVEIKDFERRFINLRKATLQELKEKKVPLSDFREALSILPSTLSSTNEKFVLSKLPLFEKAESIGRIFAHLSFYLSYIDFDLLEHIIEEFGSEHLKEDMSCYAQDMRQFKARTTISDALNYLPKPKFSDQKNIPEGLSDFTVEFDVDVNVVTLEELDELRKIHADEFQLSRLAFFLFKLQKRSLLVTWLVPTSLETIISDKIQEKNVSFFFNNNILELSLDGKKLYPFNKEVRK